jgi:multidrug efflux pump subunit AcrA (membrane-fusion protein)
VSTSGYSSDPSQSQTSGSRASAGSVDEEAILRAKQEIQSLVQEVVHLSKSEAEPTEFFAALLDKSISALAAIGGVVWTIEEGAGFKLEYQVNLQQTGLAEDPAAQTQHARLLSHIVQRGESTLVAPHSGTGVGEDGDATAANPTSFLLVVAPIKTDRGVDGLVEIFQRTGARPTTQRGYLRFLEQICDLAGEYMKTRRLRHFATKQTLWEQLENFTAGVHERLNSRETAYTIANEGRRLIGCDRVTVVIRKGGKYVVEAISGQDTFDKRSNVVRLLRNLSTVVCKSGEDLWYAGDTSDLSPQVEKAVNAYVDESHTKQIAVLPLRERDPNADDKSKPPQRTNMLGAIVIEQLVDSRPPEGLLQRVDVVRRHSSTALTNAQSHEGLFLLPLWRTIGKSRVLVTARNLPKTILASIILAAAVAAMWLVPWDFTVVADGKLLPVTRSKVFAALDGVVIDVPVDDGQVVKKGEVVARQQSLDLESEITRLRGEIEKNQKDLDLAKNRRRLLEGQQGARQFDYEELTTEIRRLQKDQESLEKQQNILSQKQRKLDITSPIDGKVVTWKVRELIEGRPVRTGTRLMEIADPRQDWELEIEVPESKMGHVVRQLRTLEASNPAAQMEVSFILATHPSIELRGQVTRINPSAEVNGDQGNTVRMHVSFNQNELLKLTAQDEASGAAALAELKKSLKVGADVKAKIHCGREPVGYVLFSDLWEFIQSRILFRF